MRVGGAGPLEILVVLLLVLFLAVGPKNLPKLGSALGRTVRNIRRGIDDTKGPEAVEASEVDDSAPNEAEKADEDGTTTTDDGSTSRSVKD
ncbi:MAG: twin-arginine translocase TatA/TatE family subunit [Coriobacteriales bacterium]|nr:twin-arginine translocase TatA/TatE family subunit [Coriobacteriales bacterium]